MILDDALEACLLRRYSTSVLRAGRKAIMAERKDRSFIFKVPEGTSLEELQKAIKEELEEDDNITVFQELGNGQYLIETEETTGAEKLIANGFDCKDIHVGCNPPHGFQTNVSIMGLRAYVEDCEVIAALQPYGELKTEIIRLKYKADHPLAGLQNGNRLVRMILHKPSIPYSIKIAGEWCRIIHSHQQKICSECKKVGHSRRQCPTIECRKCHDLGHMARDCTTNTPVTTNGESSQANNSTEPAKTDESNEENNTQNAETAPENPALPTQENTATPNAENPPANSQEPDTAIANTDTDMKTEDLKPRSCLKSHSRSLIFVNNGSVKKHCTESRSKPPSAETDIVKVYLNPKNVFRSINSMYVQ